MADLFKAFKSALSQAGPGLVAQMQGKDQLAMQLYKQGATTDQINKDNRQRQFSNDMKMQDMALKIQQAKDSMALRQSRDYRDQQLFELKMQAAREGRADDTKMQQLRDTYSSKTNNPVSFDPSRRDNAIIDMITGETVDKVYTGVQNRFDIKDARSVGKNVAKEMERQAPVKAVLNSLDVIEELLDRGVAAVDKTEPVFGARIGFTGKVRNGLQTVQRTSGMFEQSEVDILFERFDSHATRILANQVRSFTGAQATDNERQFLAKMGPQPGFSPSTNKIKIMELRAMMKYIDDRNAAIMARLGKPITNIADHITPNQSLEMFYLDNVKGRFGDEVIEEQKAALLPDQQEKMNRYLSNQRRMIQIKKQLGNEE
jgi:hypothetical protein